MAPPETDGNDLAAIAEALLRKGASASRVLGIINLADGGGAEPSAPTRGRQRRQPEEGSVRIGHDDILRILASGVALTASQVRDALPGLTPEAAHRHLNHGVKVGSLEKQGERYHYTYSLAKGVTPPPGPGLPTQEPTVPGRSNKKAVVELFQKYGRLTTEDVAKHFGITRSAARQQINGAGREGVVKRVPETFPAQYALSTQVSIPMAGSDAPARQRRTKREGVPRLMRDTVLEALKLLKKATRLKLTETTGHPENAIAAHLERALADREILSEGKAHPYTYSLTAKGVTRLEKAKKAAAKAAAAKDEGQAPKKGAKGGLVANSEVVEAIRRVGRPMTTGEIAELFPQIKRTACDQHVFNATKKGFLVAKGDGTTKKKLYSVPPTKELVKNGHNGASHSHAAIVAQA